MAEQQNRTLTDQYMVRLPDGMRERLKALAGLNKRSMNAEIIEAIEAHLDLAEHGQQVAEEMRSDGPAPERVRGTWYLHSDDGGRITKRTLISEWEEIEAERGIHADDVRIISCSRADEASDPVKARMAADVRRSREIAEKREQGD